MYVLRGRARTLDADREVTRELAGRVAESREPALRVWTPPRQVAFGQRDANREGYATARESAVEREFTPVERSVGGHAVAYTGNTVAFSCAEPVEKARTGIDDRYERTTATLASALAALGVEVWEGEPDGAFCPGTHSLSAAGKIAGLAQRVKSDVAVVGGIVVVRDHGPIADVLEPVYAALGVPFERSAVGSIARAGGDADPDTVVRTIEEAFLGGDEPAVEQVRET